MPSFAPFAEFADTHSSANSANGANGCFGSIARTIKSFEKALHIFSPHPFLPPIPSALSTLSAPSIFSFGQNDIAKGPHLEAHSGRTTISKSPFCKAKLSRKASFRGVGVRRWIRNQKKGNTCVLPLLMQRYYINGRKPNIQRNILTNRTGDGKKKLDSIHFL